MSDRPVREHLVVAGLLGAAATTAGIALTATSGWLVVRASEQPPVLALLTAIVAVRAFGIARPVLRYVERLRSHDASLRDLADRRARTYARLVPLTPARLGRRRRADLLTGVVDDLTDIVEAQVRVAVPVISAALAGLATTAFVSLLAPPAGLVLGALLAAMAALALLAYRLELRSQGRLLAARADVNRVSELVCRHGLDLMAIGAQDTVSGWLDEAQGELQRATVRQSAGRALTAGGLVLLVGAATVAVSALAGLASVSAPVKGLLILTPVAVLEAFQPLADAMRAAARARGAARRLATVLDQAPAISDSSSASDPRRAGPLEATNVSLALTRAAASWDGASPAVGPLDLFVRPCANLLVTGPNGAGKSTFIALVARQLALSAGSYAIGGRDVEELPLADVRSLVAVVDDEPHVFASTVRENLRLAAPHRGSGEPGPSDAEISEALQRAGLATWLSGLPRGLDTMLGTGGRGVSGGERARLAVARAVLSRRPVVVLDEPLAHLDHPTATDLLDDVLAGAAGRTVVLVSHQPVEARRFDALLELG